MFRLILLPTDTKHYNFTNIFRIFSVVQTANSHNQARQDWEELQKFEQVYYPFYNALA